MLVYVSGLRRSGVLRLLLDELTELHLRDERLHGEETGDPEHALGLEQHTAHVEHHAHVAGGARDHRLQHETLHHLHPLERALSLEGAHANLQPAALNRAHDVGDLLDGVRALEEVDDRLVLAVEAALPVALAGDNLRGQRAGIVVDEEVTSVGRGDLADVELLVEALADAVEDGEGPDDEGELGGEPEGLILGHDQQILADVAEDLLATLLLLLLCALLLKLSLVLLLVLGPLLLLLLHAVVERAQEEVRGALHSGHVAAVHQHAHLGKRLHRAV
mmetsp:Transcript_4373/g.16436  ORF Transcript_4373/g.16436 Transcript_4373/m.16436 type:complete len:276 (-) Transcript_4373:1568-2395(-)